MKWSMCRPTGVTGWLIVLELEGMQTTMDRGTPSMGMSRPERTNFELGASLSWERRSVDIS